MHNKCTQKTIVFACGGTLGHINPAIAMAEYLRNDYRIIFISSMKEKNNETYKKYNFLVYYFDSYGFNRKKIFQNFTNINKNRRVKKEIIKVLKDENVDLVISMGGSIGTLTALVASKMQIKTIIHEQNAVIGLGNSIAYHKVDRVLLSYPIDKIKKGIVVGNPLKFKNNNIKQNEDIILIFGGSLGAKVINDFFIDNFNHINWKHKVVLIVGTKYYQENIIKIRNSESINLKIIDKTDEMDKLYQRAYVVISRSGATTLNEIINYQKIAIVIPSPNVTNNHQYHNAAYYYNKGCIEMINEKEISIEKINQLLNDLNDNKKREQISKNINDNKIKNCKELFKREILNLIGD